MCLVDCSEMEAVRPQWEVVGGKESGGILVRDGQSIKSVAIADRLSTGATIEQLDLKGDRLQYRLIDGKGPAEGWVSTKISGRVLVVPKSTTESPDLGEKQSAPEAQAAVTEAAEPVDTGVDIDADLRKKVEADAQVANEKNLFPLHLMKYKVQGFPLPQPKFRVLCFHNAGSTESNYTGPGTPFITWIKETKAVELLAFDYPGRNKLLKEPKHTCAQTLASLLVAVAFEKLTDGVPYVVWAHSMGTWVAFEFLMLCRKAGLPLPKAAFLMAFPGPQLPVESRPWRQNKGLADKEMRQEVLDWDRDHFTGAGKIVFDSPGWEEQWEPLMRADFQVFDEYDFQHAGAAKFDFPIHAWHFSEEHYNKPEMIQLWGEWTSSTFDCRTMQNMGHLTCFYKPDLKKRYFQEVTDLLRGYAEL